MGLRCFVTHHYSSLVLHISELQTGFQPSEAGVGDGIAIKDVEYKQDGENGDATQIDLTHELLLEGSSLAKRQGAQCVGQVALVPGYLDLVEFALLHVTGCRVSSSDMHG